MICTLDESRRRIKPVAEKYGLRAVYLFGSYARGEATEDSDIDLLIDRTGSSVYGMLDMGGLYNDLQSCCEKEIDLVTTHVLNQQNTKERIPSFIDTLNRERVLIYAEE